MGRLGPYRVTSLLGLGGMGQVFRAEDTRLKRTVALKVMNQKFAATPNSQRRFVDEARSMAAVHHDNVATIFEVGQHKKTPFMAMELLHGGSLEQLLADGRKFSHEEIIEIAKQTSLGLNAAHELGITHRDIKPANLWMQSPQERIKILDFGLALAGTGIDELSATGSVVGSLGYLAPEQASNEPVDERTDLYALGVVMYEMCCGKLPLLNGNVSSQLVTILTQDPVPLLERNAAVPVPLADLISRLLMKEPGKRVPTATVLYKRLVDVADEIEHGQQKQLEINIAPAETLNERGKNARSKPNVIRTLAVDPELEDDEFMLDDDESVSTPLKWLPIVAGVLVVLSIAAYFALKPRRVAQQTTEINRGSQSDSPSESSQRPTERQQTNPRQPAISDGLPITAKTLQPLQLTALDNETPKIVAAGNFVSFRVRLSNQADSAETDPKTIHRGAPKVAQVAVYLEKDGERLDDSPAFPNLFPAKRLPTPGKEISVSFNFPTTHLEPGDYRVIFELQTHQGGLVTQAQSELRLTKSS